MTCIVGLCDGQSVWMGGDSAAVEQSHYLKRTGRPKVFINAGFLIAYTTSFRMGQLLEHRFEPPPAPADVEMLPAFMMTEFADAARELFKAFGWLKTENGRDEGGVFLVGTKGHLFLVDDDFNVLTMAEHYAAIGAGESVALGAMCATEGLGLPPVHRIERALAAAEMFVTGVRAPFTITRLQS